MTSERNKKIAALAFARDDEPGPMAGKLIEAECDPDVDACTLLVRDFPEEESLDELKSRMLDFAPLRCPPQRQKDGQIHFVFYSPKDVQSVLEWFKPHPIARFAGYPLQMFALKDAPPYKTNPIQLFGPVMGVAMTQSRWGGRWTAVHSLWTYFHHLLHVMGIAAVDKEELALLAGQLVRIRAVRPRKPPVVLAHHVDPLHPEEPVGWVDPNLAPFESSLFFLHFDSADHSRPDRARIATAAPSDTSPRAWLAVDPKTGVISLTSCEHGAAVFDVRKSSSSRDSAFSLQCNCTAGRYLSVHADTMRARICSNYVAASESFLFNTIPLPPTLTNEQEPPHDCTMAVAYNNTRSTPIRIQSRAKGWFLSSKPGTPLASAESKDSGWDSFTLDYDSATRSARIRDSRGLYLGFSSDLTELVAGTDTLTEEGGEESTQRAPHPERFIVYPSGNDDTVVLRSRKGYLSARRGGKIVLNKDTLPRSNEKFYLRVALPSMMDHSTPRLRMRVCEGGARQVEASVLVPARAAVAYEVLCDYDGFHEFIKDASESKILEKKSDTELTVLMVQCHTFLVLTIPMTMVLDVKETPETLSVKMNLKRGLGVKEYRGVWQAVDRADGRCLIRCTLVASTSVPAPGCLMDGLMSHATHATMEQLRAECIRRSTVEKHGTNAKGTLVVS